MSLWFSNAPKMFANLQVLLIEIIGNCTGRFEYNEMMLCIIKYYVKLSNIELIFGEFSGNYGVSSWFPL